MINARQLAITLCGAAMFSIAHAEDNHNPDNARAHLQAHHGGGLFSYVELERLEYLSNDGEPQFLWDVQGWYGGDVNKLWLKSEGEYAFSGGGLEEAEIQALWSRAVGSYFDLQAGVRHDFAPGDDRTFAVIGAQGLTPYLFEIDTAIFVSEDGDVSARLEAEYEFLVTQRLILQPRAELNFEFQDAPAYELGSGLSSVELGGRLRYEIRRQFAPYVGVSWRRAYGDTARYIRADGGEPGGVSFVAGLRMWF